MSFITSIKDRITPKNTIIGVSVIAILALGYYAFTSLSGKPVSSNTGRARKPNSNKPQHNNPGQSPQDNAQTLEEFFTRLRNENIEIISKCDITISDNAFFTTKIEGNEVEICEVNNGILLKNILTPRLEKNLKLIGSEVTINTQSFMNCCIELINALNNTIIKDLKNGQSAAFNSSFNGTFLLETTTGLSQTQAQIIEIKFSKMNGGILAVTDCMVKPHEIKINI